MATKAITRMPSASLAQCELSFLRREPIDVERAMAQHAGYRAALTDAGVEVDLLPAIDALPDAVFVEDTAIVLGEMAIIAPMGAASRQPETAAIRDVLARYRPVHTLMPPATLDGGDVLHIGRTLYVGQTPRTNRTAVDQLTALLQPFDYRVVGVPITKCLHLKSAVTSLRDTTVLVNADWVDASSFVGCAIIMAVEPWGANALAVNDRVLIPASAPLTVQRLRDAGLSVMPVDIAELQKAEAGVTCLSLLL
jgi:dimethylargininase